MLCNELPLVADQDKQIGSLIQTEAQTYRDLPLIPNLTSTFLAQPANKDIQKIVIQGLVVKALKDWFTPTLTMITAGI
jgi:hypothetical protein